jgi:hypothetical protein
MTNPNPAAPLTDAINDCGKDDCTPVEHWQRLYFAARATSTPAGLDVAWEEAEAALPEGKRLQPEFARTIGGKWRVQERHALRESERDTGPWVTAFGDTPADALRALRAALHGADR